MDKVVCLSNFTAPTLNEAEGFALSVVEHNVMPANIGHLLITNSEQGGVHFWIDTVQLSTLVQTTKLISI